MTDKDCDRKAILTGTHGASDVDVLCQAAAHARKGSRKRSKSDAEEEEGRRSEKTRSDVAASDVAAPFNGESLVVL